MAADAAAGADPAADAAQRRTGLLCLLVTSFGWGFNWPAMKLLLAQLPPLFARGTAGLAAALLVAAAALALGHGLGVPRAERGRLLLASFLNVFAWMGLTTLSLRWLDVAQAALLVYTMPVWATLLAWPVRGERPTARSACGLLLCLAGLWVLFAGPAVSFGAGRLVGVGLALAAALLFALGTVALRPVAGVAPLPLAAWQMALGCLPMVVLGLLFERPEPARVDALGWALMSYMTLVPMALCYLTWFAALRRLPPATASVATLLTPVIGVCAAAVALGEPFGTRQVAALALTIGGVALAIRR